MNGLTKKSWGVLGLVFAVVTSGSLINAEGKKLPVESTAVGKTEKIKKVVPVDSKKEEPKKKVVAKKIEAKKVVPVDPKKEIKKEKPVLGKVKKHKPIEEEPIAVEKELGKIEGSVVEKVASAPAKPYLFVRLLASMIQKLDSRSGSYYSEEHNWFIRKFYDLLDSVYWLVKREKLFDATSRREKEAKARREEAVKLQDDINNLTDCGESSLNLSGELAKVIGGAHSDKDIARLKNMLKDVQNKKEAAILKKIMQIAKRCQEQDAQIKNTRLMINSLFSGCANKNVYLSLYNKAKTGKCSKEDLELVKEMRAGTKNSQERGILDGLIDRISFKLDQRSLNDEIEELKRLKELDRLKFKQGNEKAKKKLCEDVDKLSDLTKDASPEDAQEDLRNIVDLRTLTIKAFRKYDKQIKGKKRKLAEELTKKD